MPQALPALATVFAADAAWYFVLVRTILINVALGALEFEEDGDTWAACDE